MCFDLPGSCLPLCLWVLAARCCASLLIALHPSSAHLNSACFDLHVSFLCGPFECWPRAAVHEPEYVLHPSCAHYGTPLHLQPSRTRRSRWQTPWLSMWPIGRQSIRPTMKGKRSRCHPSPSRDLACLPQFGTLCIGCV